MALGGEAIAVDECIVLREVEYARAGVSRLCYVFGKYVKQRWTHALVVLV